MPKGIHWRWGRGWRWVKWKHLAMLMPKGRRWPKRWGWGRHWLTRRMTERHSRLETPRGLGIQKHSETPRRLERRWGWGWQRLMGFDWQMEIQKHYLMLMD